MNTTAQEILEIIQKDPLPAAHTSSYWKEFGEQMTVEMKGDQLILLSAGCEALGKERLHNRFLRWLERAYYAPVSSKMSAFPKIWQTALSLCRDLSCTPNFNVFKCCMVLATLAEQWEKQKWDPKTFAVIGDGYGFLGTLIRRYRPDSRLYLIDLPKMLAFQCRSQQLTDPKTKTLLLTGTKSDPSASVIFVPADSLSLVNEPIDCAINVDSMQEMKTTSIAGYFTFLRRHSRDGSHFYCVNRESKTLPGGEVINFKDYPWQANDKIFLDGPCPYLKIFLSYRPPFINKFQKTWHRLAQLAYER